MENTGEKSEANRRKREELRAMKARQRELGDRSLIIVHTGDGKGKTTAAMGMVYRTIAHGWKAAVVQFIKNSEDFKYGEAKLADQFDNLDLFTMGAGFTWNTDNPDKDQAAAQAAWAKAEEIILGGQHRLVLLDEINYALSYKHLPLEPVLDTLSKKPEGMHIVLTGRGAAPELIEVADLVTEMKMVKHPFQQGIMAQKGIEW